MNNHNLFNTVFISDTGNKSVRILTSAKALIPLQQRFAQYANVFRIDAKAKKEDLPGAFEGHVKHVEEVITFLNHHEHKALERTGKRNTNGPDFAIPRATRQSFLIVLESLTSLANTLTEIGHEHLLYFLKVWRYWLWNDFLKGWGQTTTCPPWLTILSEELVASKTTCFAFARRTFLISLGPINFIRRK